MIRMRVFEVNAVSSVSNLNDNKEVAPIEKFIALIGYENIKNIIVSAPNNYSCYYAIFYEDGLPYTPPPVPEKKGLFGF